MGMSYAMRQHTELFRDKFRSYTLKLENKSSARVQSEMVSYMYKYLYQKLSMFFIYNMHDNYAANYTQKYGIIKQTGLLIKLTYVSNVQSILIRKYYQVRSMCTPWATMHHVFYMCFDSETFIPQYDAGGVVICLISYYVTTLPQVDMAFMTIDFVVQELIVDVEDRFTTIPQQNNTYLLINIKWHLSATIK